MFLEGQEPGAVCHLHGGWFADLLEPAPGALPGSDDVRPAGPGEYEHVERPRSFRRWLRKVFGKQRDNRPPPRNPPPPPRPPP